MTIVSSKKHKVSDTGDATLSTNFKAMEFISVLYVLNLRRNFISTGSLIKIGHIVAFFVIKCWILKSLQKNKVVRYRKIRCLQWT